MPSENLSHNKPTVAAVLTGCWLILSPYFFGNNSSIQKAIVKHWAAFLLVSNYWVKVGYVLNMVKGQITKKERTLGVIPLQLYNIFHCDYSH